MHKTIVFLQQLNHGDIPAANLIVGVITLGVVAWVMLVFIPSNARRD